MIEKYVFENVTGHGKARYVSTVGNGTLYIPVSSFQGKKPPRILEVTIKELV